MAGGPVRRTLVELGDTRQQIHRHFAELANDRLPAAPYGWQCVWLAVDPADDVGMHERKALMLTDPRWAALACTQALERSAARSDA